MNKLIKILAIYLVLLLYHDIAYSQKVTWSKYFDFFHSVQDEDCDDVLQTCDGGYAMLVDMGSIELIKLDPKGKLIWYKILDSSYVEFGFLVPNSFQQTSDSGFIIAGRDDSTRAFLFKMDKSGNLLWRKYFFTPGYHSEFLSVKITQDNGFVACGNIYNSSNSKFYVVKTDFMGKLQWSKLMGDLTDNLAFDIIYSSDNNYYFVGASSSSGNSTGVLKKLNSNGDLVWNKHFYSGGLKLVQNESGFIYTGGGQGTLYINKFDTSGQQIWEKSYFTGGYYFGMCLTANDNFAFAGAFTDSVGIDVIATKLDSSGALILNKIVYPHDTYFDAALSIKYTNDNGFIIGGKTSFGNSSFNFNALAIKTDSLFNAPPIVGIRNNVKGIKNFSLIQNYPNPFNPTTIISYQLPVNSFVSLKIYDVLGKEILNLVNEKQEEGSYSVNFNGSKLPSGIYFYKIEANNSLSNGQEFIAARKMLLIK